MILNIQFSGPHADAEAVATGAPHEQPTRGQAHDRASPGRLVRALPALATAAVAALTIAGFVATDIQAHRDAAAKQANLAAKIRTLARYTVGATLQRSEDLAGALGADWARRSAIFPPVARDLLHGPGINGVGLIERVPATARTDWERTHGPIELRASATSAPTPAPTSAQYLAVADSFANVPEPSSTGLDLGAERSRQPTLLAAALSGMPRATPPVRLMNGPLGTALYTPIYGPPPAGMPASPLGAALSGFGAAGALAGAVRTALAQLGGGAARPASGALGAALARLAGEAGRTSISPAIRLRVGAHARAAANGPQKTTPAHAHPTTSTPALRASARTHAHTAANGAHNTTTPPPIHPTPPRPPALRAHTHTRARAAANGTRKPTPHPVLSAQPSITLLGFLSTSYRYGSLLRALQRTLPADASFSVSDGSTVLLADGRPQNAAQSTIALAGRRWTLAVGTPPAALALPLTILGAGALVTLLVGALGVQARRREHYAQAMVTRRLAEREVAGRALAEAEERFRTAFAEAPIGMALVSLEGRFLQVNRALAQITGYQEQQLRELQFASELTHPEDRRADRRASAAMRAGETRIHDTEKRYVHAAGHVVWVAVHTTLIRDERGQPAYFLSQIEDITARRRYEAQLQHMADHDSLTGLLNRRAYERRLEEHLLRGERYGHEGAVLVIDLDAFKEVNDTLGHSAGDDLIVRVAGALAERVRESDTLARLGGDEFAILTPVGGRIEAEQLAHSLLATVRKQRAARGPGGRERPITASIGVAPLASAVGLGAEEALINADLAMYDAKEAGRDRIETYGGPSQGQARIEARLEWVERIRAALDEDRLTLHAQPVVETATGRATQHELLVRMVDAHGDLIQPGSFLPIAERFGLIGEIDRWVITRAIGMLAEHAAAGRRPVVEINISGHSLSDPELAAEIGSELRRSGVDARQLIFEVTETVAIDNIAAARTLAEALGELGCRFALDDFGAGFGSFYYLKHLPFDFIKIDGEFVRNCTADATDRLVIGAVVELARGMGKRTVAEFVGNEATLQTLQQLGVDYAQGFHLGRPAPLESWLKAPEPRRS
jgi:diguanylate cyclase (GGDEF)-like protein/PAS domain S-box-containing protein